MIDLLIIKACTKLLLLRYHVVSIVVTEVNGNRARNFCCALSRSNLAAVEHHLQGSMDMQEVIMEKMEITATVHAVERGFMDEDNSPTNETDNK